MPNHPITVPALAHEAGAGAVSLENYANRVAKPFTDPAKADASRSERWRVRGLLWSLSTLPRVRACGRVTVMPGALVGVRANGVTVGFSGLASCGSVWACPVCNVKIQSVRKLELGVALAKILGDGGGAMFGAYTLRHHSRTDADDLWRGLSYGWQSVSRDGTVKRMREGLGHSGLVRSAEVTYGANGWHPHLHPIHLFARPVTDSDAIALHTEQVRAWTSAAERLGWQAPSDLAQHLHPVTLPGAASALSEYLSKVTWEMTSTQTKTGKTSRTPWQILKDSVSVEDINDGRRDLALWREYERFSKGKRALTWSRGLRDYVGLNDEATDEQVAAAESGTKDDTVLTVDSWVKFGRNSTLGAGLLAAVGVHGNAEAGAAFCDLHGVPYTLRSGADVLEQVGVVQRAPDVVRGE